MGDPQPREPYRCRLHYDPSVEGVWIGFGTDLSPVCGHRDYIGVTGNAEIVECKNCLRSMRDVASP